MHELTNLLRYRQLISALTARDLKARYRGSVLGFFWSLANPLLLLGVYTLVFTRFFPQQVVSPYPLFLFAGILPGFDRMRAGCSRTADRMSALPGCGTLTKKNAGSRRDNSVSGNV